MANTTPISNALNIRLAQKLSDMPTVGGNDGDTAATDGTEFTDTQRNLALNQAYTELALRLINKYGAEAASICEGLVATQSIYFISAGVTVNKDYVMPLDLLSDTDLFLKRSKAFLDQDKDTYIDRAYAIEAGKIYVYTRAASGTVGDIIITAGGTGYGAAPAVTLTAPPSGGTQATATCTISGGIVVTITITNVGAGYVSAPTVSFASGAATATATLGTGILLLRDSNSGTFYYIKADRHDTATAGDVAVNIAPDTTIDAQWLEWCMEYAAWWLAINKGAEPWLSLAAGFMAQVEAKLPK